MVIETFITTLKLLHHIGYAFLVYQHLLDHLSGESTFLQLSCAVRIQIPSRWTRQHWTSNGYFFLLPVPSAKKTKEREYSIRDSSEMIVLWFIDIRITYMFYHRIKNMWYVVVVIITSFQSHHFIVRSSHTSRTCMNGMAEWCDDLLSVISRDTMTLTPHIRFIPPLDLICNSHTPFWSAIQTWKKHSSSSLICTWNRKLYHSQ